MHACDCCNVLSVFCAVHWATPCSYPKATHPPTETFLLSMCDYISPASSPHSEPVPGVGVGVESGPFSLSIGCYWWGEVMDLPAALTGTLRIHQTVGKTQPAIPPLSRLNCHFISFIYGSAALFWTPPLSVLPLKTLLFFFFLTYVLLWQPIYTPVLFPGKHISLPHIFSRIIPCLSLVYVEVKMWAAWEPIQPSITPWTKGCRDSVLLWSGGGLSTGLAFNIRHCSASSSSSALRAESYLSWLSSRNSPLGLRLSHLERKMQPKPALSFRVEKMNFLCVLAEK